MATVDEPNSPNSPDQVEAPSRSGAAPVKIFISYAHRDEDFRLELNDHLSNLQRQGLIAGWHDRQIMPGQQWADQIDQALNEARIILLLVSARFMASDYCYAKEMRRAIARHDANEAVVIPVILSACDRQGAPFSKLQALPKDAKPIKNWNDRDEAWLDVVRGLRRVIEELMRPPSAVSTPPINSNSPARINLSSERPATQSAEALDALGKQLALEVVMSGGELLDATRDQVKQRLEEEKRRHGQAGEARAQNAYLEEVMHWINFNRLREFLSHGEQQYTKDGFAALCVVQQSELMGGRWGMMRIQSWLKTEGKQPKEIHIQPVHNETFDATMISSRLATAFDVEPGEVSGGVSVITRKICGSFHHDRRILITIQPCDEFDDATWQWILREFWCSLLHEFRQSQNRHRVRLLVVLLTDLSLESDSVVAHCCDTSVAAFDQAKLARLPLDHWTEDELFDWLVEYWPNSRTDQELKALARKIFSGSNQGQPLAIYSLCKKWLLREANS